MTKRIVSGVFLLVALGALGLILAGALTSGEQLIVRFLTAIIVAALGLYVISDLRLQADDSAVANAATGRTPVGATRFANADSPPPNSTAAFMATVTGKKSTTASLDQTKQTGLDVAAPTGQIPVTLDDGPSSLDSSSQATSDEIDPLVEARKAEVEEEQEAAEVSALLAGRTLQPMTVLEEDQSPYSQDDLEVGQWPLTPDGKILDHDASSGADEEEIDGLVAVFTKQAEQELRKQEPAMAMGGHLRPVLVGGEASQASPFKLSDVFKSFEQPSATDSPDNPANGSSTDSSGTTGDTTVNGTDNVTDGNGHLSAGIGNGNDHSVDGNNAAVDEARPEQVALCALPVDNTTEPATVDAKSSDQTTMLPRPKAELEAASYTQARIIDLRLSKEATDDIEAAIQSGEVDVISTLMNDGVLSTEGPISDRDVRTMVYVAFTSNELRKILSAGGTIDADHDDLDLGPVEVFSAPTPTSNPELTSSSAAGSIADGDGMTSI